MPGYIRPLKSCVNSFLSFATFVAGVALSQSKANRLFFCLSFPTNYTLCTLLVYSFLSDPSYRTDRNGEILEFASSEACCGKHMSTVTSPVAHVDYNSLYSNMEWTCRSHAHLEASIGVLVETFISHAKKARTVYCHKCSPVPCLLYTNAPLDLHPMLGPVSYLTTNYTAYLIN